MKARFLLLPLLLALCAAHTHAQNMPCPDPLAPSAPADMKRELFTFVGIAEPCRIRVRDSKGTERLLRMGIGEPSAAILTVIAGMPVERIGTAWITYDAKSSVVIEFSALGKPAAPAAPSVPARVVVSPLAVTVRSGETAQLGARVLDASGAIIPDAAIEWLVYNPRAATVTSAGLLTATGSAPTTTSVYARVRVGTAFVTSNFVRVTIRR